MTIELEPWGGIVLRWGSLQLLVDPYGHEHWWTLGGRPLVRRATPVC